VNMRNMTNENERRRTIKPLWRYENHIIGGMGTGRIKIRNPLLYPTELQTHVYLRTLDSFDAFLSIT